MDENDTLLKKDCFNEINKIKKLKEEINELINRENFETAEYKIKDYKNIFPYDIDIYSMEATILLIKNKLEDAKEKIKEGLEKRPFNFELAYNFAVIYNCEENYVKTLIWLNRAFKYANSDDERNIVNKLKDEIIERSFDAHEKNQQINEAINKINEEKKRLDPRSFPLITKDKTYIGKFLFSENNRGYYAGLYNTTYASYDAQLWKLYKTETIYGKLVHFKKKIYIEEPSVIPISIKKMGVKIKIRIDKKIYNLRDLYPNRFYYLPIRKRCKVEIVADNSFFLGDVLKLEDPKEKKDIKLVLNIFIDGLAQTIIDGEKFKKYMPNTYDFFKDGARFNHVHTSGEWTLSSVPAFFTGKYTTGHKLFHPNFNYAIGEKEPLISEIFRKNGYFTFQVCGDWRKSPAYGYARGFNRTIYQQSMEGMSCEENIMETIEQLEAFKDRKHFVWMSLFELHKVGDNILPKISSQLRNNLITLTTEKDDKKSVNKEYDTKKIEKYITEINRLDYYLKILYDYIGSKYSDDEILITIVSDHGQSYINKSNVLLAEERIKVPFIIKGNGVPSGVVDEYIETVDIYPTILKLANIDNPIKNMDGNLPKHFGGEKEREYAYTESIYPNKTYKAVINDREHSFNFETTDNVENDGRFPVTNPKMQLINKKTGKDEKDIYIDKVDYYKSVVFNHVKEYIKI
ncbi:sulfatase-like hydrolase/transferase [Crassaminicella profunda]|uniref:sulfatase-like hydrolase/transferase n=1 Tax=Crassaminicella profunda TaxID=1286698 RepID=UPI001CA72D9D|nr:sulfatase-like hydrolase/transferase [Crassaminicella profunda]QZY54326.1 sulfatase-like hydrolase/transferase [Crassaminicella profunda]